MRSPRTLRSSVEVTAVTATVRDATGACAGDLPLDAFSVYEDGEPQAITQFTHERVPVGLGLLLDVSDSMFGQRIRDARAAVERFLLELLSPDDAFFVMAFNHAPRLLTPWTSDPATRCGTRSTRCSRRAARRSTTRVTDGAAAHRRRPRERAALVLDLGRRRYRQRRHAARSALGAAAHRRLHLRRGHRFARAAGDQHARESGSAR